MTDAKSVTYLPIPLHSPWLSWMASVVRSWTPKVLMCQAIKGLLGYRDESKQLFDLFIHYMAIERLGTFSFFLPSFSFVPKWGKRISMLRTEYFAGTKAWRIRIYGAQRRMKCCRASCGADLVCCLGTEMSHGSDGSDSFQNICWKARNEYGVAREWYDYGLPYARLCHSAYVSCP